MSDYLACLFHSEDAEDFAKERRGKPPRLPAVKWLGRNQVRLTDGSSAGKIVRDVLLLRFFSQIVPTYFQICFAARGWQFFGFAHAKSIPRPGIREGIHSQHQDPLDDQESHWARHSNYLGQRKR